MRYLTVICVLFFFLNCKSTHKLTGSDFVDLSAGETASASSNFPSEIADSLGWGDLSSSALEKVNEEFRIALSSGYEPFHLYRIKKGKDVEGEVVIYWEKKTTTNAISPLSEMRQYLKAKCSEFHETLNFEYCKPSYKIEPDWKRVYESFEGRNIWLIPDQSSLEAELNSDSTTWIMDVQVRLGNYYRTYMHTSPDQYSGLSSAVDIKGIASQLQLVNTMFISSDNFNTYTGITNGEINSAFLLCDGNETWRFDANLDELATESGIPIKIEPAENAYFLVTISGMVEDEWYGNRNNSGFLRVIKPSELNEVSVLSSYKCPTKL